ncbi:MAG: hypothetical protein GXO70_06255 [Acidobacteria bacterium]|nr:hypothetical protein [Acidobacteriota bacterium]
MNKQKPKEITNWEIKIPVFKNPLLWCQLFIVSFLSSGFVLVLLVGLNLFEYHWEEIPNSFLVWAILAGGIFLAFAVILMLLFRGVVTRYTISEKGVVQETLTPYRKFAKKVPFLALLFGGKQGITTAGAGMLAKSREVIFAPWKDISLVELYPSRMEIRLKNQWRTVMQIICLPENYREIAELAQRSVSIKPGEGPDSVFFQVVFTFLTLLLGVALFPRLPIHVPGVFVILMMLLFAFPTIWSTTKLRKISAAIILITLLAGVFLAFYFGEVDFSGEGALYAASIEFLSFAFFSALALRGIFSGKTAEKE